MGIIFVYQSKTIANDQTWFCNHVLLCCCVSGIIDCLREVLLWIAAKTSIPESGIFKYELVFFTPLFYQEYMFWSSLADFHVWDGHFYCNIVSKCLLTLLLWFCCLKLLFVFLSNVTSSMFCSAYIIHDEYIVHTTSCVT